MLKFSNYYKKVKLVFIVACLLFVVIGITNGMLMRSTAENFWELQEDRALSYSLELNGSFNMARRNYMAVIGFAAGGQQVTSHNFAIFNESLDTTVIYLERSLGALRKTTIHPNSESDMQMRGFIDIMYLIRAYRSNAESMYNAILADNIYDAIALTHLGVSMADRISGFLKDFIEFNRLNLDTRFEQSGERALRVSIVFVIQTFLGIVILLALTKYIKDKFKDPFIRLLEDVNEVVKGNLNTDLRKGSQDEMGVLYNHIESIVIVLRSLISGLSDVNKNIRDGGKKSHIDETQFRGAFKEIALISNEICESLSQETDDVVRTIREYNKGNFSVKLRRFSNEKEEIHEVLDDLQKQLKLVNKEVTLLIQNIIAGSLDARVISKNYSGDWQSTMTGLNYIMEHVERPINELESVITRLANGDTSARVRGNYYGKFNHMKSALNKVAETLDEKQS